MDIKSKIIDISKELKIAEVGFSNIVSYDYMKEYLEKRKQNGDFCEFEDLDIEKRINATKLLPECKSIIAAIFPYANGFANINVKNIEEKGIISVSSFREDYHFVVRRKLKELVDLLQAECSFNFKICVDTEPLIDREVCKKSRLGFIGKNNMLLNDSYGSFVFLGYILTDIEIDCENDELKSDPCGNCKICVNNCKSKAIVKHKDFKVNNCISYLTQTKNYIPLELRKLMGQQIYGCDTCQLNCPKNNKILNEDSFNNYDDLFVDLKQFITISNSEFNARYGHMSCAWRGKNILKRNAIISVGNLKLCNCFDIVKDELDSKSDMIKMYSAWTLIQLNPNKAKSILNKKLVYEDIKISDEYKKLMEVLQ